MFSSNSDRIGWPIDHAPLFPPALLSPEAALIAHRSGAESPQRQWLNSLVWPFSRIHELDGADPSPHIALLVTAADNEQPEPVRERALLLGSQLKHIESAVLPDDALLPLAADTPIFVEVPTAGATAEEIASSLDDLQSATATPLHAKVRCGGSPAQVPTSSELATFIHECATRNISWKATAGLHAGTPLLDADHPHHGLVNVITAAAAGSEGATLAEIQALLEDENPPPLTNDVLSSAAQSFMSLGSCSFEEPLEALEANQTNEHRETHQ